jgi:hypothetical protein
VEEREREVVARERKMRERRGCMGGEALGPGRVGPRARPDHRLSRRSIARTTTSRKQIANQKPKQDGRTMHIVKRNMLQHDATPMST